MWYCDDPFIEFIGDEEVGRMTLDGIEYDLCVGHAIRDFQIYLCDREKYSESTATNDDLIWEGEAKVKGEKLYITVTKDHVSTYEGKTIVLKQRPV